MNVFVLAKCVAVVLCLGLAGSSVAAAQDTGRIEGTVSDSGGGVLPGVLVELSRAGVPRPVRSATTTADGAYRFDGVRPGSYIVRVALAGFSSAELPVVVAAAETVTVPVSLQIQRLQESVQVVASEVKLDTTTSTQATTFSNQVLNELPTASRNYTHVIVAEAGVNAPLPDRTGRGLNIATNPGTQGDDASQSLNPSVNGARPTNNRLRDQRHRRHEHAQRRRRARQQRRHPARRAGQVEVQTALPSAARGRNGGGNIELNVRSGHGPLLRHRPAHYFQHETAERQRVLPEPGRRREARIPSQRHDGHARRARCVRGRTFFFGAGQRQVFRSGYASNANAATGLPTGLTDVRTAETIAGVANEWLRTGAAGRSAVRRQLHDRAASLPGRAAGRADRQVLRRSRVADVPRADARRHPSGRAQHPQSAAGRAAADSVAAPALQHAAGQRHVRAGVPPAAGHSDRAARAISGFGLGAASQRGSNQTRADVSRARSRRSKKRSAGRTRRRRRRSGRTPAWLGGVSNTHTFGSRICCTRSTSATSTCRTRASRSTATSSIRRSASTTRSSTASAASPR